MKHTNYLITGAPGVGKTTLIRKISTALADKNPTGFFTTEIRNQGIRDGFELVSLKGKKKVLSHVRFKGPAKVGKYGVDVEGFDDFLNDAGFDDPSAQLYIIDEIGKMECFSDKFFSLLKKVLDSEKTVLATIALKGSDVIEDIKKRPDVQLFELTKSNREETADEILSLIGE